MKIVRKILQEHSLNKYAKLSVKEKDTKKKYGRERDIEICLKKANKNWKNINKQL